MPNMPNTMTEDQLSAEIEATMKAAWLACQPYLLQLAPLWLPGVEVARANFSITSVPIGIRAQIDAISFSLQKPSAPAPTPAPAPAA